MHETKDEAHIHPSWCASEGPPASGRSARPTLQHSQSFLADLLAQLRTHKMQQELHSCRAKCVSMQRGSFLFHGALGKPIGQLGLLKEQNAWVHEVNEAVDDEPERHV